jgi:hypothetical protein
MSLVGLLSLAPAARAGNILYFVDGNNGTDEMAAALAALSSDTVTDATGPADFATKIATDTYQLGIFSAQEAYGADYSAALAALDTFVKGGGDAIVDSWFTPLGSDVAPFGGDYTDTINQTSVTLTAFNAGVTNPVTISQQTPSYATFSDDLTLDVTTGVSVAATFGDGSDAIVVGNGGRSIVNGFLNDTAGAAGKQIYENEINGLLSATPEPSGLTLLGFGIAGMIGYARLRRHRSIQ